MNPKKVFWDFHVDPAVKRQVRCGAVAGYVIGGLSFLMAIFSGAVFYVNEIMVMAMIFDGALMLGLGLGLHIAKSRACAIALLAYFGISKLIQIVSGQMMGTAFILAIGLLVLMALGVKGTVAFQRLWKEYELGLLQQQFAGGQQPQYGPGAWPQQPVQPQQPQQAWPQQQAQLPVQPPHQTGEALRDETSFAEQERQREEKEKEE